MDWTTERQKCEESSEANFWKPTEGRHKIKILSEPERYEKDFSDGKGMQKRIRIDIEVDGSKKTWGMTEKYGDRAMWGMLLKLGSLMQGEGKELIGATITLLVKGKERDRSYVISEMYEYVERAKKAVGAGAQAPSPSNSQNISKIGIETYV